MKFKVFTANTIQEAMAQVKNELGMDAVILHTRRFNKGGIFGYLGKEMVEVMAAIDDKKPEKPKSAKVEIKEPEPIKYIEQPNIMPANPPVITDNSIAKEPNNDKVNYLPPQVSVKAYQGNKDSQEQDHKIKELEQELSNMKKMLEQVINDSKNRKTNQSNANIKQL